MTKRFLTGLALVGTLLLMACGNNTNDALTLTTAVPAAGATPTGSSNTGTTGATNPSATTTSAATRPANRPAQRASMNFSAPEFTLQNLQNQSVNLADYQGQPVIINFWATWCGPCKQELPLLTRTYNANKDKIAVLGIDVGEEISLVKLKVREVGISYTNLLDKDEKVSGNYRVNAFPTSYFLDKDGIIRYFSSGALDEATLQQGMAKIQG